MFDPQLLDRMIWNTLHYGWAHLAEGDSRAVRIDPDYGPFGAAADGSDAAQAALGALVPEDGQLWIVEAEAVAPPPGTQLIRTADLTQMVCEAFAPLTSDAAIVDLTDADAFEMRELALMTEPGPFHVSTHRLGRFVGVRENGRLIAMAGERMRLPGLAEVSAVCTHPDCRGRGLAGGLMSVVMQRMIDAGETPFLHSYAGNAGAIALYERLGFRVRRAMVVTVVEPQDAVRRNI